MDTQLLSSSYQGDLDRFVADLVKYDGIIKVWSVIHQDYDAYVESDIDDGEYYTIRVICRKRSEK